MTTVEDRRLWQPTDPRDFGFAEGRIRGAWDESRGLCKACGYNLVREIAPLIITWEPGSDLVGDFTWPGSARTLVSERAADVLERFAPIVRGPVEYVDDPGRRRRKGDTRVPFPYEGPPQVEVRSSVCVDVDLARSTIDASPPCDHCGSVYRTIHGWETRARGEIVPREPGNGLFVPTADLGGAGVFHLHQTSGRPLYCTTEVRRAIEAEGLTNVHFAEIGDLV